MSTTGRFVAGAAALVMVTGCNRAATPEPERASVTTPSAPSDTELVTAVRAKLFTNDVVRASHVDVRAENGVVTLEGQVASEGARQEAVSGAQAVEGVQRVEDRLEVVTTGNETQAARAQGDRNAAANGGAAGETRRGTSGEPTVTTRILAQYFVTPSVKPWNVDVTATGDGVVTLEGEVDSAEARQEAERVARETGGVLRVENRLRVRGEDSERSTGVGTGGGDAVAGDLQQPDAWITTKIQAKYFIDDEVKARDIDVSTQNGHVTLSGAVESADQRRQAMALARSTDGVREVTDNLTVERPESSPGANAATRGTTRVANAVEDAWVTTTLQARYFIDPDVKGLTIDVDTRNGVVTLQGEVESAAQKTAAEAIARDTSGVSRVVNQLRVRSGA